jgi:hypothetical protein
MKKGLASKYKELENKVLDLIKELGGSVSLEELLYAIKPRASWQSLGIPLDDWVESKLNRGSTLNDSIDSYTKFRNLKKMGRKSSIKESREGEVDLLTLNTGYGGYSFEERLETILLKLEKRGLVEIEGTQITSL